MNVKIIKVWIVMLRMVENAYRKIIIDKVRAIPHKLVRDEQWKGGPMW